MYRALRSHSPPRNDSPEVEKFYEVSENHAPGSFLRKNISWFLFFSSLIVNLGFIVVITAEKDLTKCLETSKFGLLFPIHLSQSQVHYGKVLIIHSQPD